MGEYLLYCIFCVPCVFFNMNIIYHIVFNMIYLPIKATRPNEGFSIKINHSSTWEYTNQNIRINKQEIHDNNLDGIIKIYSVR